MIFAVDWTLRTNIFLSPIAQYLFNFKWGKKFHFSILCEIYFILLSYLISSHFRIYYFILHFNLFYSVLIYSVWCYCIFVWLWFDWFKFIKILLFFVWTGLKLTWLPRLSYWFDCFLWFQFILLYFLLLFLLSGLELAY